MQLSLGVVGVLLLFLLGSCKQDSSSGKSGAAASGKKIELDAFPSDQLSKIRSEGTSIDLISLKKDVNISMSFDNPQSYSIIMSFLTEDKGILTNMCTPDAHLMVQKNGDIIQEMDLYYKNGCNAMVFMDTQGKKIAANQISNEGMDFFNNFLKSKSTQDSLGR
ncbi:MAG: hypothetical protein IPM34_10610 [Saprospiraceae bacterium]|nr:hypothetical protein [Saprospiraceae bacterium]